MLTRSPRAGGRPAQRESEGQRGSGAGSAQRLGERPSKALVKLDLVGRLTGAGKLGAMGLALALFTLARWFWTFGVRHYSGASA